jgi:hypothetical protein
MLRWLAASCGDSSIVSGKERVLSIGPYPGTGLADARAMTAEAKQLLREGKDRPEKRRQRLTVATESGTHLRPLRGNGTRSIRDKGRLARL